MAAVTLLSLFPKPEDVLALTPEDFGGVIIELIPPLLQNGMFNPATLLGLSDYRTILSAGIEARGRTRRRRSHFMAGHRGPFGPRSGAAIAWLLCADAPRTGLKDAHGRRGVPQRVALGAGGPEPVESANKTVGTIGGCFTFTGKRRRSWTLLLRVIRHHQAATS
jgi:hypothetical protein